MSTTRTRLAGFAKLASVGALSALVAGGISAAADSSAQAHGHSHEPANVTTVKNDVKAYYGDTVDAQGHHHHSNNSAWARDIQHQVDGAKRYLQDRLRSHHLHNPALVLDVDDTSADVDAALFGDRVPKAGVDVKEAIRRHVRQRHARG